MRKSLMAQIIASLVGTGQEPVRKRMPNTRSPDTAAPKVFIKTKGQIRAAKPQPSGAAKLKRTAKTNKNIRAHASKR